MRIAGFLLIIFFTAGLGQSTNPFEIQSRLTKGKNFGYSDSRDSIDQGTSHNPFDITKIGPSQLSDSGLAEKRQKGTPSAWMFIVAFLSVVLMTAGVAIDKSRAISIFKSTVNSNFLKTLIKNSSLGRDFQLFLLYILFFTNMATFIYLSIHSGIFNLDIGYQLSWAIIFLFFLLVYVLRHLTMWAIGVIFPLGNSVNNYNYSIAFHNIVIGGILLPIVLSMQFGPENGTLYLYYFGLIVVGAIYFLRQSKGFLLALGLRGFNPIYFFIYLCAIEIGPILLGLRVLFDSVL